MMNIEKIKTDLALRVQHLMTTGNEVHNNGVKITAKSKSWCDKVADAEDLVKKIYDTLNEVLQCNGIHLANHLEYDTLISDLEPTVNDLVIKNMED